MANIVKIDPLEFGLTVETAANIENQFAPMLAKMTELEVEFNGVLALDKSLPTTAKKARELRLKYKDVRVGTEKIHKVQKAYYLNGGRFVDSWKNIQAIASQNNEEVLESIEKHAENLEKERLEKLQILRVALLAEYAENASDLMLSSMPDDVFEAYLTTKKQQFEDRKAAELKAEQDRIAREKAEAEAREAQRLENIRLKEEADKREAEIEAERARIEAERKAEREKAEAEAEKIRAENEKKLKAEQAERARIEKENADQLAKLQAEKDAEIAKQKEMARKVQEELYNKRIAEEEAERVRIAAEKAAKLEAEKLAKAPIKSQLTAWVNSFQIPQTAIEHEKKALIIEKFGRFLDWAKNEVDAI